MADLPTLTPQQLAVLRRVPSAPESTVGSHSATHEELWLGGLVNDLGPGDVYHAHYQRTPLGDAVVEAAER